MDDNGKITRTRRECPTCGGGVFMALHTGRHTCGKCSLTFRVKNDGEANA